MLADLALDFHLDPVLAILNFHLAVVLVQIEIATGDWGLGIKQYIRKVAS